MKNNKSKYLIEEEVSVLRHHLVFSDLLHAAVIEQIPATSTPVQASSCQQ